MRRLTCSHPFAGRQPSVRPDGRNLLEYDTCASPHPPTAAHCWPEKPLALGPAPKPPLPLLLPLPPPPDAPVPAPDRVDLAGGAL